MRKQRIFDDGSDYLRFVQNLYRFNNTEGSIKVDSYKDPIAKFPPQDRIIEILRWVLLPNHYHLIVVEKVEGGVVDFVKRLGNGYTKYINIKKETSGYLFQNSAKIIPITGQGQFLYIPFYVDMNILDLMPKQKGKISTSKVLDFFKKYKWSSFPDYFGEEETAFTRVINKELFYETFDFEPTDYLEELKGFIKENDEDHRVWKDSFQR